MKEMIIRFIFPVSIFVVLGIIILYNPSFSYLRPQKIENYAQLEKKYKQGDRKIEANIKTLTYTGYDCTKKNKKVGSFYYTYVDNYCLFVLIRNEDKAEQTLKNYKLKALVEPSSPAYEKMSQSLAKDLNWTQDKFSMISAAFFVSEVDYPYVQLYLIMACFGVALILAIVLLVIDIRQLTRYLSKKSGIDGVV